LLAARYVKISNKKKEGRNSLEMIAHVVLLQPKTTTTNEELSAFLERVRALQQVIPGIVAISVGENRSTHHRGFTHGIIMHFVDEAHLQAHHSHPAHLAVVEELDRICQQTIDFDLPDDPGRATQDTVH
jgi:quinol monooxygenase YgiN